MSAHYRKTHKKYKANNDKSRCPFCTPETVAKSVLTTELCYVVPNITKYDVWELHDVTDHLLILPKRHVTKLQELTDQERLDIMNIAAKYEAKGYNVYARGKNFVKRSQEHQHTHLIKATNKRPWIFFYLSKPYFVFKK